MKSNLKEAVPVGRLLEEDGKTIGWVYRWNTLEMSIFWLSDTHDLISIEFSPVPGLTCASNEAVECLLRTLLADGDKV